MTARAPTRQLEPDGSRVWQPRGQSRIIDSDGSVLGQLAEEEGVLTADAVMDLARKHNEAQPSFGGWLQPGPWVGRQS